jgi:hypothetical protein
VSHIHFLLDYVELMLTLHCGIAAAAVLLPLLLLLLLLLPFCDCSVISLRHGRQAADADEASAGHQHREWQQI